MATSYLLAELFNKAFKPDSDGERKICKVVVKLLSAIQTGAPACCACPRASPLRPPARDVAGKLHSRASLRAARVAPASLAARVAYAGARKPACGRPAARSPPRHARARLRAGAAASCDPLSSPRVRNAKPARAWRTNRASAARRPRIRLAPPAHLHAGACVLIPARRAQVRELFLFTQPRGAALFPDVLPRERCMDR